MEAACTAAPPAGDSRTRDVHDDGYETCSGGDGAQPKPAESEPKSNEPELVTSAGETDSSPKPIECRSPEDTSREPVLAADVKMSDNADADVSDANVDDSAPIVRNSEKHKCEVLVDDEEKRESTEHTLECHDETAISFPVTMERDNESRMEDVTSASNSPKRRESLNPDESSVSRDHVPSSPCASNSRSNSSLGAPRSQTVPFDNSESVQGNMLPMHPEDSSSQSQSYPPLGRNDQLNPYDMKNRLPQFPYVQMRAPEMSFGDIKREPYDMSTGEHDPYAHYKRENDPYCRNIDPYSRYKRPEEMFMNNYKDEMQYPGFGAMKRDQNPYAMKCDPYPQHPFSSGIKREHEADMLGYNGIKRECSEDPYSFVDEEAAMCAMLNQGNPNMMQGQGNPMQGDMMMAPHMIQSVPKKRGRKKKVKEESINIKQEGLDGGPVMTIAKPVKERKKHDRFNGMSEEEVCRRTLPDHLTQNLDIIIIGINPGLFAAYKGHHYAGPGNHFWKCLYLSGLTQEQMSADEDYKLLHFGIGFTNMVQRATKGSADLTRKEIKEGSQVLLEKLQTFRPKIAVFNGKLIYEVFSGKKDFCFGRQPDCVHGTNTYMWVMPSSSARCAQLPRAADKVPFYSALRRFRDYLNGGISHIDESELVFPDTTCRRAHEDQEIRRLVGPDPPCETMVLEDGTEVPVKKKRGRPKKVKLENGEVVPPTPRAPRAPKQPQADALNGEQPPKKKRGRPKKVRPDEQQYLTQQQQQTQQQQSTTQSNITPVLPSMPLNQTLNLSQQNVDGQYQQNIHTDREFQQTSLNLENPTSMMYPNNLSSGTNQTLANNGSIQSQNQNLSVNVPSGSATSPYFPSSLNSTSVNSSAEPSTNLENAQQALSSGTAGTPASLGNIPRGQPGYGHSPGPFSQSPRSHGVGYGSSPRPAGYSQSPQRHQTIPPSYANSPAAQGQTPHPYSQSPVPQNPNPQYSQSPPLRPLSQNHNYSQASPIPGNHYSRSPAPQNNTPTYSQQSPMFAHSPANMPHPYSQSPVPQGQAYSQHSPAPQAIGYGCRSPVPLNHPYPHSPLSQGASYPQLSPAQNHSTHPYSQSPQNSGMYSQSPVPQPQSYQHSPMHVRSHPYSPVAHSLPHHPVYGQSPIHQPQSRHNPVYSHSPPQNMSLNNPANNPPLSHQQYHTELSTEISAAISSPSGPASPSIGHIDFEPPILDNQMHVQETETNSSTHSVSQRTSPGGDQIANDLRQNTNNVNNESSLAIDVSHTSSHDSSDLMDTCANSLLQMPPNHQHNNQNRHSALNLIGPSSSSNTSSPIPSSMDPNKTNMDLSRNYTNSIYTQPNSNEAQSPISNEQRLGFQVPTPSGSANSSYGTVTPVAADLSNVPRNSPRDVDNASVASVSSQHERMGSISTSVSYSLGGYTGDPGGSPRQTESAGLLPHHTVPMYGNPFTRMESTPPHHPLVSQASPFSSQSGNGAFRGLPLDVSQGSPQSLAIQGSSGQPLDYGPPIKTSTTKQQDVSSKSLSGLESLVDQIPSIADGGPSIAPDVTAHTGPTPVPPLENPYAAHAPSLYGPYSPYQPSPYGPPSVSNNGYSSALAAGSFVGYPGSPYGQLMRPTPGYLPEALSPYHPHSGYPGLPTQQYGPGGGYGPTGPPPNYSAYYNGYGPASIQNTAANMPTYLTSHVLDHIHKNAAADASSNGTRGFPERNT